MDQQKVSQRQIFLDLTSTHFHMGSSQKVPKSNIQGQHQSHLFAVFALKNISYAER